MGNIAKARSELQAKALANVPNLLAGSITHENGQVIAAGGLNITDLVGRYRQQQTTGAAQQWADAQNTAENAQINLQETEDRIAENKTRNQAMSGLAFGQGTAGNQGATIGRGLFQRRRSGARIGTALGSLAQANSGALATARRSSLKAQQAADITRTNPVLGYGAAMQRAMS